MTSIIGPMIAQSAGLAVATAKRLLEGIDPSQMARFARVGGVTIQSNHPSFILGHLSLYPCRVVAELGHDARSLQPSPKFEECFSFNARCVDDPEGVIYPSADEIKRRFFEVHEAVIALLPAADDRLFEAENPNERMRPKFSTMGSMHAFYLGGHLMLHMGQFSAWRRAMGLGPA